MSELGVSLIFNLVNRLSGPAAALRQSISGVSKGLEEASTQALNASRSMKALEDSYSQMQKRLETSQRLSFVGMEMSRLGKGLTSPLKSAALTASDFEERMSAVSAVTRGTADDMAALTKQARDLGSSTHFTAIQAAEGMKFLGMTGFETTEILASMPSVLDMAKAGGMDLARTADIASNVLSGFGLEATEMTRVADVIVATFTRANASTEQIGDTMKYVAPLAREAGMSLEEAAAMAGLLGDAGIQGSMAGTAMRGMLSKLANPAGDAAKLFEELNLELLDMDGNLRSPVAILGELAEEMKDMGSGERLKALSTIFDDRAAAGMAKLIRDEGVGGITKFIDVLSQADGTARRVAEQMGDNTKGGIIELLSAIEGLKIAFGDLLGPVVDFLSDTLKRLTVWMTNLTENHEGWAKALGITVAVIGGLAMTVGWLLSTLAGLYGTYAVLAHMMGWLSIKTGVTTLGFKAFSMTLLGGVKKALLGTIGGLAKLAVAGWAAIAPFWPIIAIVAAVAGSAILIVKFWKPIAGFFSMLWGGVKAGASKVWEVIKAVFGFSPLGLIIKNWEPIVKFFQGLWEKIGGIFSRLGSVFGMSTRAATAGAMAGAAVAAMPLSAPAEIGSITPIEQTIAETRSNNSSSTINAPITINAAPGQNPEQIASAVTRALDARERQSAARNRGRLYD